MDVLSSALARDLARLIHPVVRDVIRAELPAPPPEDRPGKEWLTNAEAMAYLGLSRPTLARYRKAGTLPFSKVGANVFYKLADVEALLERHRVDASRRHQ